MIIEDSVDGQPFDDGRYCPECFPWRPDARVSDRCAAHAKAGERCDACGAEGFRLTISPDGEAQVCDGCLAALTGAKAGDR